MTSTLFQETAESLAVTTRPKQNWSWESVWLWGAMLLGAALRIRVYLANRSLWADEAALALDVRSKSFLQLMGPLDWAQAAPFGFLWISKAMTHIADTEYALRAFPLLCGLVTLPLSYLLFRQLSSRRCSLLALTLLSIGGCFVYYSSEFKPYAGDVALSLALMLLTLSWIKSPAIGFGRLMVLCLAGTVAFVCSYAAEIVMVAATFSLIVDAFEHRDPRRLRFACGLGLFWMLISIAYYCLLLRPVAGNSQLIEGNAGAFMPIIPRSSADLQWYAEQFYRVSRQIFRGPSGAAVAGLFSGFALGGFISAFRRWKKPHLILLIGPLVIALFLSALKRYPFANRLILFALPPLLLFAAEGVSLVWRSTLRDRRAVAAGLFAALMIAPLGSALKELIRPTRDYDIKPALAFIASEGHAGDTVYLNDGSVKAALYYRDRFNLSKLQLVDATIFPDTLEYDNAWLKPISGRSQVWLVFCQDSQWSDLSGRRVACAVAEQHGLRLHSFVGESAAAFEYDLSRGIGR